MKRKIEAKKIVVEFNRQDIKALEKIFYWADVGLKNIKPKMRSFLDRENYITEEQKESIKTIKSILTFGSLATSKSGYELDVDAEYLKGKIKGVNK